jgi:transcriptional regulator with PAS, ATPase and Fis domain
VVIGQGGTAACISEAVSIPVVAINLSVAAFLEAINEARGHGKPLALIAYKGEVLNEFERLARLVPDLQHDVFAYKDRNEFMAQVETLLNMRRHTIVGLGMCTAALAAEHGMNHVLVKSTEKDIEQALLSAVNIVQHTVKQEIRTARQNAIIDNTGEGILSLDKDGRIQIFDRTSERFFNVPAGAVLGKKITGELQDHYIKKLYGNGLPVANKLIKIGSTDVLINRIPIHVHGERQELLITFTEVSYIKKLESHAARQLHERGLVAKYRFEDIIHSGKAMKHTIAKARRFAKTMASVLVEGETGTGKELLVQSIHNASPCRKGPFVAVNCAALPESILESELFGHDEGAFTGSRKGGKSGLFELAHNGTIFLDEIGEISPVIQSQLLRVLQEKVIIRVGGDRVINTDVRIIAATNKNLYAMALEGRFRMDLYFRLNVLNLTVSPLRERKEDIPLLVARFIATGNEKYGVNCPGFSPAALKLLQAYSWPGNVRELEFFVEQMLVQYEPATDIDALVAEGFAEHKAKHGSQRPSAPGDTLTISVGTMREMQQQILAERLERCKGNKKRLARELGLSRATVWKRLLKPDSPEEHPAAG